MLKAYACAPGGGFTSLAPAQMSQALWFDLENPTPEDYAFVTRETGLPLPRQDDILEIESSSRLSANGDVLTLTMPIVTRTPDGLQSSACGFVLAPDRLVTIRFIPGQVFTQFASQPQEAGTPGTNAALIFIGLLEAIVDRQADALENLRRELDDLSHQIFHHRLSTKPQDRAARRRNAEAELQATLAVLGRGYDSISFLRDSQLGIARIAPYVLGTAGWLPEPAKQRLQSVEKDIASLNEFSTHLTDKVQFLLDATLGLINVAQNSLIKVLTIVSIVGIPPTLIAGIYGMNFHDIPEITWRYGYVYAWGMMILSSMLPLVWFRKKGWL